MRFFQRLLILSTLSIALAASAHAEKKAALSADTVFQAVEKAVEAQPGKVDEVRVLQEGDKTLVLVEVVCQANKEHHVKLKSKDLSVVSKETVSEKFEDAALPKDQVLSAAKAILEKHPGQVHDIEIEEKDGNTYVHVEVVKADGTVDEIWINPASGEILK